MSKPIVYFDVDDTSVRTAGTKRMPIVSVVDRVRSALPVGSARYVVSDTILMMNGTNTTTNPVLRRLLRWSNNSSSTLNTATTTLSAKER
jgi:hypothetical protein